MFLKKTFLISVLLLLSWGGSALAQSPADWYHYNKGMRYLEARQWYQAQNEFLYYLRNPEMHWDMFGVAHFGLGLVYQARGENEPAIEHFRLAVENDAHDDVKVSEKALLNLGAIYFKAEEYAKAAQEYEKVLELNPENGMAHYYLGFCALYAGEFEKARKAGARAKRLGVPFTKLDEELKNKN